MKLLYAICLFYLYIYRFIVFVNSIEITYDLLRNKVMETENSMAVGGNLWLSSAEERANSILMNAKHEEFSKGMKNLTKYPPALHFFRGKQFLRQSEVFRIIQKLPKGTVLHGHNIGMVNSKWIIGNLTTRYNLYTCHDRNGRLLFTYHQNYSECQDISQNICLERVESDNKRLYDKKLEKHISMYHINPESFLTKITNIWNQFENIFKTIESLLQYMPTYCNYHQRLLEELYEDNIIYAEIRVSLTPLYGDNNKIYNSLDVANELEYIVNEFKKKHTDFLGIKLIYTKPNKASVDEMSQWFKTFKELHQAKPNFIIGFDLIGREDIGDPLQKFYDELFDLPSTAYLFLHAGATNWYGKIDWNLMDALLLNTKRIGHGFALTKHPQLLATIKKRNVAIEISPISNQIFGLIWDLRNHPSTALIADNYPIVISSDYPGLWNAKGLSYDFYYAFMAMAPAEADLRFLKQLALNSIKHSILNSEERRLINNIFQKKWEQFIYNIINMKF